MHIVRGRVIKVRTRADGTFGVTLVAGADGRHFLWRLFSRPPRLGALVEVADPVMERYVQPSPPATVITVLSGGTERIVPDPWARRFVPPQWLRACQTATWPRLYPHQLEAAGWLAERLTRRQGGILADDPGLGKTLTTATALLVAKALPAFVCCPASLKSTWVREIAELRIPLEVATIEGFAGPLPRAHVLVGNYDLLRTREQQLARIGARVVVFDEAHILKEPDPESTHRAAVATRLARAIGTAVLLTGTPLPNRPAELWRLLHLVDPLEWPEFESFKDRYCHRPVHDDIVGRQLVTDHGSVYNYDELQARMAPCMMRRLKSEVLPHLPPKRRNVLTVELEPMDREHYDRAEKDVVEWLRQLGSAARAEGAAKGQAIVKLQMLRRIAAIGKLRTAVPRLLNNWFARREPPRLVVFAYHRQILRGVDAICRELGVRAVRLGRRPSQRQAVIDDFNAGHAAVFLGPILAAGVGLNLQSASHALFLERLWEPWAMVQAEDRIHRLGQTQAVDIVYLDAARTVDGHIAAVLAAKQHLIDVVVDDRSRTSERESIDAATMAELMTRLGIA